MVVEYYFSLMILLIKHLKKEKPYQKKKKIDEKQLTFDV